MSTGRKQLNLCGGAKTVDPLQAQQRIILRYILSIASLMLHGAEERMYPKVVSPRRALHSHIVVVQQGYSSPCGI
jgi:hypothetical protein